VLGTATIAVLRMLARRWRRSDAVASAVPYGPPAVPQDLTTDEAGL
jgi:hypothetical protein